MNKNSLYIRTTDIEIDLTTLCNANCPLCFRNQKNYPQKYKKPIIRDINDLIKQLDLFNSLKTVLLIGQLSEPTLYPYLFKLIEYLNSRNINIKINTNGDTHDDLFWYELGNLLKDSDEVRFTICGSEQNIHEKYRKNTNLQNILRHSDIIRNIRKIDSLNCIKFNYNKDNLNSDEFLDICNKFTSYIIFNTNTLDKSNYNNIENFNDFDIDIPNTFSFTKIKKYADFLFRLKNNNILCKSETNNSIYIDVYGIIYPCYYFFEQNFNDIWSFDYKDIKSKKFLCCSLCQKEILTNLNKMDYDG